jgi:hypothetical protein
MSSRYEVAANNNVTRTWTGATLKADTSEINVIQEQGVMLLCDYGTTGPISTRALPMAILKLCCVM